MPAPFWLYRSGCCIFDSTRRRAIWSETWLSETEEIPDPVHGLIFTPPLPRLDLLWGTADASLIYTSSTFFERLHPAPRSFTGPRLSPNSLHRVLNPNAPEAAFRLRRVGAAGSYGRMTPPILLDSWFTDLPRRRHIDMGRFGPLVPAVGAGWPSTVFDQFGRRYDNVIFHRKTLTWTPLTHYELHPNPVRIWQRWKPVPFFSPKLNWRPIPDEIDFYGGDENNP